MSPDERIRHALDLGRRGVRFYADARGISHDEARTILARNKRIGRRPSACMEAWLLRRVHEALDHAGIADLPREARTLWAHIRSGD